MSSENAMHRFPFAGYSILAICLACPGVLVAGAAKASDDSADVSAQAAKPEGIRLNRLKEDAAADAGRSFGVFIGIDSYPGLPGSSLDGCVRDAMSLQRIFTSTFGVKRYVLLTNAQASRAGIGQVLDALVEEVRQARAKSAEPITVVITYAGHGQRVLRKTVNEANPGDTMESTWVASDCRSFEDGTADVRASELFKVYSALAEAGAQVIMISDACHSGAGFRGRGKARTFKRATLPEGSKDDLFASLKTRALDAKPAEVQSGPMGEYRPLPGFVWYAACKNSEVAFEAIDEQRRPCGRLSYVLRQLLPEVASKTTYGELAAQIATKFAENPEYCDQHPQFHASIKKTDEHFLKGGKAPLHARIIAGSLKDGSVDLNMGRIHGVSTAAHFVFYQNSEDLEARSKPIAEAPVTDVADFTCTVKLGAVAVPATAVAALDAVRMDNFVVGIDGEVPADMVAKLHELDQNKQIVLAAPDAGCDVALHYFPQTRQIGIYSATALPPRPGDAQRSEVHPLRPLISFNQPADAETVATNLLYLGRIRAILGLKHEGMLGLNAEIVPRHYSGRAPAPAPVAADRDPTACGIPRLARGERFVLRFTNHEPSRLYITVFTVDRDGTVEILYPNGDDDRRPLDPNESLEFPGPSAIPFNAKVEDPESAKKAGFERTVMKVVACDQDIDFAPLVKIPPQTGAKNTRDLTRAKGATNPLFGLMRDALHGTRGVSREAAAAGEWTTAEITFDVVPAK